METRITHNQLNECTEELKQKIEKTRAKLNNIYMSNKSYEEKIKVSEELDVLIVKAMEQMEASKNKK